MRTDQVIKTINKASDSGDFMETRRLLELNIGVLKDPSYIHMLNQNARVLLQIVTEAYRNTKYPPLTRQEKSVIAALNQASRDFDLITIKFLLKEHLELVHRPDAQEFLNMDATDILISMGAILTNHTYNK